MFCSFFAKEQTARCKPRISELVFLHVQPAALEPTKCQYLEILPISLIERSAVKGPAIVQYHGLKRGGCSLHVHCCARSCLAIGVSPPRKICGILDNISIGYFLRGQCVVCA